MSVLKAREEFDKAFLLWQIDLLLKQEAVQIDTCQNTLFNAGQEQSSALRLSYHEGRRDALEEFKEFLDEYCLVYEGEVNGCS